MTEIAEIEKLQRTVKDDGKCLTVGEISDETTKESPSTITEFDPTSVNLLDWS